MKPFSFHPVVSLTVLSFLKAVSGPALSAEPAPQLIAPPRQVTKHERDTHEMLVAACEEFRIAGKVKGNASAFALKETRRDVLGTANSMNYSERTPLRTDPRKVCP